MGLFSKNKKKSENKEEKEQIFDLPPVINKWFDNFDDWCSDYDEEKIKESWKSFLEELAKHISDPKIILPNEAADIEDFELRGRYKGFPVKMVTYHDWMSYEADELNIIIKMKGNNDNFEIERDHEKIAIGKDPDEDWAEEDQEIRVFLEKGIFAEGEEDEVQETLSFVQSLPQDIADNMFKLIEAIPIRFVEASYGELRLINDGSPVYWKKPIEKYLKLLDLGYDIASFVSKNDISKESINKEIITQYKRVKCSYCSSTFLMGMSPNCPNCGGAYEG